MSSPPRGALTRLWLLLKPRVWQAVGLSLLLTFTAALAQLSPQFVRFTLDVLVPRGEARLFWLLGGALLLFYLASAAVGYAGMYLSYAFTQRIISDIRLRAYARLLSLPMTRLTRERSGALVSRVVGDVNALETMIQSGASRLWGQLFSIVVVLAILLTMDWRLALLSFVIVVVMAAITGRYQGPLRATARAVRRRVGELTATATEAVGNIAVVKVFANEPLEWQRFKQDNDHYVALNLSRRRQVGLMEGLIGLSAELGLTALLLLGGWQIVQRELSVGELSAFLLYLNNLISPVRSVMFFNNSLQAGMAALDRVGELLDDLPETEGTQGSPVRGDVAFEGVVFRYPGSDSDALKGLTLRVAAGQSVALVGPSGAGKTTLIGLLSRLYDPGEGRITLAGRDLRDYRLAALRRAVAVVPQDPTLFSGTVRDNIRYAKPDAPDSEVEEAAQLANAHGFITRLPQGYDTEIGERGVKLSGGQKQRVAIARAILKDAAVLVLDEATSSLDSESEAVIQDALSGLFRSRRGVTSIVIAHRLSTVQQAERIFVLADGELLEAGSHPELLYQNGLYRMLYDLQYSDNAARV